MSGQKTTVFGIYPTYPNVEHGAKALSAAGFRDSDISVLYPERTESKEEAQAENDRVQVVATVGGGPGALVGATMGSGVGLFVRVGPVFTALAGSGFGDVLGEVAGVLIGAGMPEEKAKGYESQVKSGGFLISVCSDSTERTRRARELLQQTGAQDIFHTPDRSSTKTKRNANTGVRGAA